MSARPRPLRIALTGGIASGKSYCLRRFADKGAPVIDADQLARDALTPGSPAAAAVLARFGTLDRAAIAAVVFDDPAARRALEAIVHPRVYAAIENWFAGLKAAAPFGIADIPLLFETGREKEFDRVVVVKCAPGQQRARLIDRGMRGAEADARLAAQMTVDERLAASAASGVATDIIDTSGDTHSTDRQVDAIFERLAAIPPRTCA